MNLLKTVVQTNSDTLQGTQALMLAVLQNQNRYNDRNSDDNGRSEDEDEAGELTILIMLDHAFLSQSFFSFFLSLLSFFHIFYPRDRSIFIPTCSLPVHSIKKKKKVFTAGCINFFTNFLLFIFTF